MKLTGEKTVSIQGKSLIICLFLIAITLSVFWQVQNHDFVNIDDPQYVSDNPYVKNGLSASGVIWAFTTVRAANWHPLTWLSHMLDYQLYGMNPGRHHLTSLLFHLANSVLLFLLLSRMTGAVWRSAFVAALFALHPLHVESVAWVSERKDVLSTFFWILTMWMYFLYVERPGPTRYMLALFSFALGLMAKPMLVTLPCVLLLLDYWPLERFRLGPSTDDTLATNGAPKGQGSPFFRLFLEKTPFFALAAASSIVTFIVQRSAGAVTVDLYPLKIRIANGLVSYASYMGKMIWPRSLVVFYLHPGKSLPVWHAVGAGLLLVCLSIAVIRAAREHRYLVVGWLWYLGTLVPVIGLVQVGTQAMADRYTYVPLIGLFIIVAWGIFDLLRGYRHGKVALALSAGLLLFSLATCTQLQVRYWQNSATLFQHALTINAENYLAHNNLGAALMKQGKIEEGSSHYIRALEINPNYGLAHSNLGGYLLGLGKVEEAMHHCSEAVRLNPRSPEAQNHFGLALALQGRFEEAAVHYSEALRSRPEYSQAHRNLGLALEQLGRRQEALSHYTEALRFKPDFVDAHLDLASALADQGNVREAFDHYQAALKIRPDDAGIHNNFATFLAQQGKTEQAIAQYSRALEIRPDFAEVYSNLGSVFKQQGKLDKAIAYYRKALEIKPNQAEAHNNLGVLLAKGGRLREAISHYSEALRLNPESAEIHNNLAVALVELGESQAAISHYEEAIKLKPDYAEAYNNLGNARAEQGNLQKTVESFSKALEIRPNYPEAHNNLGVALARQGRLAEAITHFKEALRLKADYVQAGANLAIAREMAGRTDKDP
jgi:tetratricopeptide (TPR) repeat protein